MFANDCLDVIGRCANRIKFISVGQCTGTVQQLQLTDYVTGAPIDLTQYDIPEGSRSSSSSSSSPSKLSSSFSSSSSGAVVKHGVEIVAKQMPWQLIFDLDIMADVRSADDAKQGIVYLNLTPARTTIPGILCGMACIWEHGIQKRQVPFYYEVTPSLLEYNASGPLTIGEVRMALRDICPDENFLIDAVDFKEEEIMWAMRRCIDYWNEIPPPVQKYTPSNFPFRYHWAMGTAAELLMMVAVWMRRNDLDYSAAGLTVEDTRKWPDYYKLGSEKLADYRGFVKNKKIEANIEGAFNSLGGYRHNPYR